MTTNDKPGKITNAITWIIMHVFMRSTMNRLDNMIDKESIEKIKRLRTEEEKASKKFDFLISKELNKQEIESNIESKKNRSNNWIRNRNLDEIKVVNGSDDDEEKNETLDNLLQRTFEDSKSEGTQLQELREKITYFLYAAKLITKRQKCSAGLICKELKLNQNNSYYIINKLEEAGVIADIYGKRNQKVLVENMEMLETLLSVTDLNDLLDENRNEDIEG